MTDFSADKDWSKQVLSGGQWCEICGSTSGEMQPHHYVHRSQCEELRTNVRNGVRVCSLCHNKAHIASKKVDGELVAGKEWFAEEFYIRRPADKETCDEIYKKSKEIK